MDLIRQLLLYFEERDSFALDQEPAIEGYDEREVQYHLLLLAQAEFIVYEASRSSTNPERLIQVYPFGLSWAGHEFLDAARDEKLWNKAKEKVVDVSGGLSLSLLQALLIHTAKKGLGIEN
jgi:hypothetical protein